MALGTLGTTLTTSLQSLNSFRSDLNFSDVGNLSNLIKDDINPAHPVLFTAFENSGLLFIPNRGVLRVLPGDAVGVDSQGWPILVSKNSIANAAWTHNP